MSYDKLLAADPGVWTITLTQGSASASVAGILLVTAGAREGDAVLDDEGRILVIKALSETEITFAWPYKAATRTIDLVIEQRSINRAINTASSTAAIAALTRLQNAADLAPNYPVLSHGNMPPAAPADGDRHLVGTDPTGVWTGRAEHLALYGAATAKWSFTPPEDGMSVVLAGTSARLQYNGTAWGLDALGSAGGQLAGPLDWAAAVDVASAATVDLGAAASNLVTVTGATAIASLGTAANGVWRLVRFAGAPTLVHGAALALPGAANIVTAAGDWALFVSRGGGTWQCVGYDRADGTPIALGADTVTAAKLADAAVSNTKLADMAAGTIKLRVLGAGSGPPVDGTPAQALSLLGIPALKNAQRQIFTTSGNFVAPASTMASTVFRIVLTGAGGGGMGGQINNVTGAGGASGSTVITWATGLVAGQSYAVTIGAPGTAGAANGGGGGTGGSASIAINGVTYSAPGGVGAVSGSGGVGSSSGANGHLVVSGCDGDDSRAAASAWWVPAGKGAASFWGGGGKGGVSQGATGLPGKAFGAGGGGGCASTSSHEAGGAGGPAICLIEWVL